MRPFNELRVSLYLNLSRCRRKTNVSCAPVFQAGSNRRLSLVKAGPSTDQIMGPFLTWVRASVDLARTLAASWGAQPPLAALTPSSRGVESARGRSVLCLNAQRPSTPPQPDAASVVMHGPSPGSEGKDMAKCNSDV